MVNFSDLSTMIRESNQTDRLWTFTAGIFFWEFVISLDYDWSIIRGRRPYRWTIWIYFLTRVAGLIIVALNQFDLQRKTPSRKNCQVTVEIQFMFAYLAFAASSLLVVLRIIAIWNRKRIIVVLATTVWGTAIAFLIQGVIRFRSSWKADGDLEGCVFYLDSIRLSTIVAFAAHMILLLIMLFGLYRLRQGGMMALGRLLWNQGVVWLLVVIVAELTPTVLIVLNFNQEMNLMFQVPCTIAMSIAATRMYRSLSDFLSPNVSQKIPSTSGRIALESNGTSTTPVFLTGIKVAVHTTHEQHSTDSTPQMLNSFGSNTGGQPYGKPHELIVNMADDHDMIEDRAEK